MSVSGTSPETIRWARAFNDRGFAHPRFANQHRVIFRAPGEHLHGAADFFVTASGNDLGRVFLTSASSVKSLVYFLSASNWFSALAELASLLSLRISLIAALELLRRESRIGEDFSGHGTAGHRQGLHQPLYRDIFIIGLGRQLFGGIEQPRRLRRYIKLVGT